VTTPADQNERSALRSAADRLELDDAGAHVVSSTSRIIWHLPGPGVAVLISRPRAKRFADVEAEASAVRIATDAGARTPRLVAGPVPLDDERIALAYDWIEGRALAAADWPAAAREFAALARGTAADLAGVAHTPSQASFEHELMTPSTVLPWLGDVIPLPRLGEVLSLGDLLLVGGIFLLVYRRMLAGLRRA